MQEFIKNLRVDGPYLLPINDSPKGTYSYKDNLAAGLNFLALRVNTKHSTHLEWSFLMTTSSVDIILYMFYKFCLLQVYKSLQLQGFLNAGLKFESCMSVKILHV